MNGTDSLLQKPPPIPDLSQIVAQYSNEGFQQNSGDVFQV